LNDKKCDPIKKISIIISHGSLDGVYPGLIMANGARMWGIEASLFYTFFGLFGIMDKSMDSLRIATVGNPAMRIPDAKGVPVPTILGAIPGMSAFATSIMKKEMEKLEIPPVREFLTMIHDSGAGIYACKATVEMFHLSKGDFCKEVDDVISVGQFYEKAAGGQIIFT
jgi:peroxiredoxin family protein